MSTEVEPSAISPRQAADILARNPRAILVDVRSSMEFLFVGHPVGAVHVAWIDEPDWDINPDFVVEVRQLLLGGVSSGHSESDAMVILICRSGKRSHEAGKLLLQHGIENVCHIDEGFEGELNDAHQRSSIGGWRYHGLPWEQC